MPCSVTMPPVISSAGVKSKAGFQQPIHGKNDTRNIKRSHIECRIPETKAYDDGTRGLKGSHIRGRISSNNSYKQRAHGTSKRNTLKAGFQQ